MNPSSTRAFAILIGVAVIALPMTLAVYQAHQLSLHSATREAYAVAREVLRRSEQTSTQIDLIAERMLAAGAEDRCSDANIDLMRRLDMSSSYIQTIGVVVDERLVCSSMGQHEPGLSLGPVAFVSPRGIRVRPSVELDFSPGTPLTVAEAAGYATLIHRDLVTDVFTDNAQVSLGVFGTASRTPIVVRGDFDPDWMTAAKVLETDTYDGRHVVAVSRSSRFGFAAYAALPATYVAAGARHIALSLVPIGALVGILSLIALLMLGRRQASLPAMIRNALKQKEFFLHYQPIVELTTGKCIGVEALIRWHRKDGTVMRPDLFIPVAEESELIRKLTARVMELVCADATKILAVAPDLQISINLSPEDLRSQRVVDELRNLIANCPLAAENLHIEMTERGIVNTDTTRAVVSAIRDLGIEVAIDDFGTGFCSLSYLTSFEVDFLKIDKSFVDTLGMAAASSQVAMHIISMGKELNLRMIAEGVETEAQATILRDAGVEYAQGWLYAKAMSPAQLVDYLRR